MVSRLQILEAGLDFLREEREELKRTKQPELLEVNRLQIGKVLREMNAEFSAEHAAAARSV